MTNLVEGAFDRTRRTYLLMGRTEEATSRDNRMTEARAYIKREVEGGETDMERLSINALKYLLSLEPRPALRAALMPWEKKTRT